MNYRCAGAGLAAAGLVMAAPLAAQTTDTGTTAPPRDPQTKPTVSPAQMIGVVKDLLQPKPSPVVFPAPTQQPTPAPAAATAVYTAPVPQPVPTLRPAVAVRPSSSPVALPSIVAPLPSATVSTSAPPPATAAESVVESGVAVSQPVPVDLIGPPRSHTLPWGLRPWWVWLIVVGAAAGLAELARRWFWPKPTLGCEIAVGAGVLTHAASPPFTAPELNIAIRIEAGEARAPIGHPVLAQGDTA